MPVVPPGEMVILKYAELERRNRSPRPGEHLLKPSE